MRFQTAILTILAMARTGMGVTTDHQRQITEYQKNIATYQQRITECQNYITNYQNQITDCQKHMENGQEPEMAENWGSCMTNCMIKWDKRTPGKKSDRIWLDYCASKCVKNPN
ncbi:hypothetical protein PspLS_08117 [Pyricularia sp. CBS 133598]|nr:hypothetical protein PspLS_08117 [Pyricularia sp. CBS 133598]